MLSNNRWSSGKDPGLSPVWPGFNSWCGQDFYKTQRLKRGTEYEPWVIITQLGWNTIFFQLLAWCLASIKQIPLSHPFIKDSWSSGKDPGLSPVWPGFDSRCGQDFYKKKQRLKRGTKYKPWVIITQPGLNTIFFQLLAWCLASKKQIPLSHPFIKDSWSSGKDPGLSLVWSGFNSRCGQTFWKKVETF